MQTNKHDSSVDDLKIREKGDKVDRKLLVQLEIFHVHTVRRKASISDSQILNPEQVSTTKRETNVFSPVVVEAVTAKKKASIPAIFFGGAITIVPRMIRNVI